MKPKRRSRHKVLQALGVMPTTERSLKLGGICVETISDPSSPSGVIKRHRARIECALDHYLEMRKISRPQFEAGMKFRRAYAVFVLKIHIEDPNHSGVRDREMPWLLPVFSERILKEAYAALSPEQRQLMVSVCGHDAGVGDSNRLGTFKRGLSVLVTLWNIP